MPTWRSGGYLFRIYQNDHPPLHVHVFKEGRLLDRYDLENGRFMDGTVGRHRGRVLAALSRIGLRSTSDDTNDQE